jgi:hypothetical protein
MRKGTQTREPVRLRLRNDYLGYSIATIPKEVMA